jgi:hypothetical protein
MDPKDFKLLGEDLCKRNTPAACRTAISRAYYYAYNAAAKFVGRYHQLPANAEAHGILLRLLKNSGDDGIKEVASSLGDLRGYRNEADYDMGEPRPEKKPHAEFCLQVATGAILDLVGVMNNLPRWETAVKEMKRNESLIKGSRPPSP